MFIWYHNVDLQCSLLKNHNNDQSSHHFLRLSENIQLDVNTRVPAFIFIWASDHSIKI